MSLEEHRDAIRVMAKPFFEQGFQTLYAAVCCERAFVSKDPIEKCRSCGGKPEAAEIGESFLIDNR